LFPARMRCTKSPLLFAHSPQIPALQQQSKKTLRKILRFLGPRTLSPHKAVNGPPIDTAKLFKRFLCRGRLALRLQNHAPGRGGKRDGVAFRISAKPG